VRRTVIHLSVLAAVALSAILLLTRYVPFETPSYLFWAGAIVVLAALISLIHPLRFLLIRTRRVAALALLGGAAASACAVSWPYRLTHAGSRTALDRAMPEYHCNEVNSIRVQASREAALRAMREVTPEEIKLFRTLMGARQLAGGQRPHFDDMRRPILGSLEKGLFPLISRDDGEVVLGRPMKLSGGNVKVAFNVRVDDEGGGWTRITTETRILAADEASVRGFSRYWRMVYPGSAIIRQMWLEAAAARLERSR
jgi:hypothetical protein